MQVWRTHVHKCIKVPRKVNRWHLLIAEQVTKLSHWSDYFSLSLLWHLACKLFVQSWSLFFNFIDSFWCRLICCFWNFWRGSPTNVIGNCLEVIHSNGYRSWWEVTDWEILLWAAAYAGLYDQGHIGSVEGVPHCDSKAVWVQLPPMPLCVNPGWVACMSLFHTSDSFT